MSQKFEAYTPDFLSLIDSGRERRGNRRSRAKIYVNRNIPDHFNAALKNRRLYHAYPTGGHTCASIYSSKSVNSSCSASATSHDLTKDP